MSRTCSRSDMSFASTGLKIRVQLTDQWSVAIGTRLREWDGRIALSSSPTRIYPTLAHAGPESIPLSRRRAP